MERARRCRATGDAGKFGWDFLFRCPRRSGKRIEARIVGRGTEIARTSSEISGEDSM